MTKKGTKDVMLEHIYPLLGLFGVYACLAVCGCMGGPSTGVPPRFAHYAGFSLTTQDGQTFNSLQIEKESLASNTFRVLFPSGREKLLEELTVDELKNDESFVRMNMWFEAGGFRAVLEEGQVAYFWYGGTFSGAKEGAVVVYIPTEREVRFPLSRAEMEQVFGTNYKLKE